jgi:hypothetical protein
MREVVAYANKCLQLRELIKELTGSNERNVTYCQTMQAFGVALAAAMSEIDKRYNMCIFSGWIH